MKCSNGFGALVGDAALPSATRPTGVPGLTLGKLMFGTLTFGTSIMSGTLMSGMSKSLLPGTPGMFSGQGHRTRRGITCVSRVAHRSHGQLPCGQVLLHRRTAVQMGDSSEISRPMYRLAAAGRR